MKRTNKLLCLLLALVFVCGLLPATAAADTSCENGHDWFRVTVVREPTCTESGLRTGVCSRCGAQLEEAIPALGHDYVCYEHTPPTCTEPGADEFKCSRCPQTWTQHFDPLGHEWETVRTEPHGLTDGSAVSTCVRCGETETEIIPAASAIFHMARNLPDDAEEAEDGDALRIVDQTYYELLTHGSGEGCTLFVTAEGGVTPYTYTWHYVTEFVPGSAVLDAATERYKGAQDAYAQKSAAVSSAFGAAAGAFALDGASLADGGEASGSGLRPFGDSAAAPQESPEYLALSAGRYYCVVTDAAGNSVTSNGIRVAYHLYFSVQPQNMNLHGKDSVTLHAFAVGTGAENIVYELVRDDGYSVELPTGAATVSEPGIYWFEANDMGSSETVYSELAEVFDAEPLWIYGEPHMYLPWDGTLMANELHTGGGIGPYKLKIERDGEVLADAFAESFLMENEAYFLDVSEPGSYLATLSDSTGESASFAFLAEIAPLQIVKQPVGGMLPEGEGAHQLFIVMGDGVEPYTYTLFRNGEVCDMTMDGAEHSVYVSESGEYYYLVEDDEGHSAESEHVVVEDYGFRIERVDVTGKIDEYGWTPSLIAVVKGGKEPIVFSWYYLGLDSAWGSQKLEADGDTLNAKLPGAYFCMAVDSEGKTAMMEGIWVDYEGGGPFIVEQPQSVTLEYREDGKYSAVLRCRAVGNTGDDSTLSYTWQKLGAGIGSGPDGGWGSWTGYGPTFSLSGGDITGVYRCVITDTRTGMYIESDTVTVQMKLGCTIDSFNAWGWGNKEMHFTIYGGSGPYEVLVYQHRIVGWADEANSAGALDYEYADIYRQTIHVDSTGFVARSSVVVDNTYDFVVQSPSNGNWVRQELSAQHYLVITDANGQTVTSETVG